MKKAASLSIFLLYFFLSAFPQQSTDLKQVFLAAESYYLFEEFDEALPLYLRLHRADPENYNLYFKIGVCYLNNPYEKDKSISYLEKASKNINPKYKESTYKEMYAPLDALFFLGNAYRINNDLDKARQAYKEFQSKMDKAIYDENLVIEQLTACDVAEKMMKKPVDMDVEILSNQINTRFADINSCVSGDESKMVFISKLQFYDAVFFTEKVNGNWTPPRNITPELGVDGDVYPTCLSWDGSILFIYRNDDFIGNLYTSKLVDGKWTPLVKLNDNINTKYWESHASVTKDGNTLYFTSNRKGGYGGLDIYKSKKQDDGNWGPAENLGPVINTPYNEETPFITASGNKIFFSSYGHYNMGGYDVFVSSLKPDGTWAPPLNMGYPVNTTDDNIFFCPVKDGEVAYYPVYKETGYGKEDIYRYKVYTADHPRRFDISGILNYQGEKVDGKDVNISVISQTSGDTLAVTNPDNQGNFVFSVPAGKYNMVFDSDRFEKIIKSLEVSPSTPHVGMSLNEAFKLVPKPVKPTDAELNSKLQLQDSVIVIKNNKPVKIDFEAEKGSVVIVKQYQDSTLVKTDTINVDKRKQTYEFVPGNGVNRVELTLTDKDGNQVTRNVTVYAKDDQIPAELKPQDNKPKENPEEVTVKEKVVEDVNTKALTSELASQADGRLKNVLENIDLEKEGISSSSELFSYLYDNADKLGISSAEIDQLVVNMIARKDLKEFLLNLKNASDGNLKNSIDSLDLKANNIDTPYEAVDFLVRNARNSGYLPEDVVKALARVGSGNSNDQQLFLNKLIQASSEGELKNYLKTLDPTTLKENSAEEFAVSLYRNSSNRPYTEEDVLKNLTSLAASRDAEMVLNKLIQQAPEGKLKEFLKGIDLNESNIYSAEALIDHIYSNADLKGFSRDDVNKLLQEYLLGNVNDIDNLRIKMASISDGQLKNFLEKMDVNDYAFGSREEFIDFLKKEALKNGYSVQDVNDAVLKLAYKGNLEDIIKALAQLSGGNLKATLLNLDPSKKGIYTFEDLISYLQENSKKNGYSEDDVYRLLGDYTASSDLEYYMAKLKRLADPEIKSFLDSLDLKANGIKDRTDLISYLLNKGNEGIINQENVIKLLLKANDIKTSEILPYLKSLSTGELNALLNSSKLPVSELQNATGLYEYLLEASLKNKGILPAEINKLFSGYIKDEALNQFLGLLADYSDGKLNEFIRKINLKDAGITSVSGLIQYLIANADANGYKVSDVYSLISKVLGREKLEDFIANLREHAPEKLAGMLDSLNLDEAGITSIEDLLKYLSDHASDYGYSMEDVWNAILHILISGQDTASTAESELHSTKANNLKGIAITGGLVGIAVIFFILLYWRKKKNKKEN
ncbi:MAG: PD40 domain-containing protein [Bacteroidales bacterium]|nr:PD40 domain-containing protein [Bacteroidales bacterium]